MGFIAGRSPGIGISASIGRGGLSAGVQGVAGGTSSPNPLKNVKLPNNPSGKKRVRSIRHKIPSGKEVPNDVPTLRWIDGA
jgi:hypothetical protein